MSWTITDRFPTWGETGTFPSDGFYYTGGDQLNEKHVDALWHNIERLETEVRDALTDIDGDGDGTVDDADQAQSIVAGGNLQGDLVAANGEVLWDESATYIPQTSLQNDSVTINAGADLSGGGSVALGNSVSVGLLNNSITINANGSLTGGGSVALGNSVDIGFDVPVDDVNGYTGSVSLDYNDVGALADHEYDPEADTHSRYQDSEAKNALTSATMQQPIPYGDIPSTSNLQSLDVSTEDTVPYGVAWNDTGSKLYLAGDSNISIYRYDCSTSFDISTASFSYEFDVSGVTSYLYDVAWNDTGSRLYFIGDDTIYQYDCSTNYDMSTASNLQSIDVSSEDDVVEGMTWNNTGSKFHFVGSGNANAYTYSCSTNYDVTTGSYSTQFDLSSQDGSPTGINFIGNGSRMVITGTNNYNVYEYSVTSDYSLSNPSFISARSVGSAEGVAVNDTESKIYIANNGSDAVDEYAYEISTDVSWT